MKTHHLDAETLAAFVLGELVEPTAAQARSHLEACGRCQAESDLARAHFQIEAHADLGPRSDTLRQRFDRALNSAGSGPRHAPAPRPRARRLSWVVAAAALVVAAIGLQQFRAPDRPPTPSGELLSAGAEQRPELRIQELGDGWSVAVAAEQETDALVLRVLDSTGETVYETESTTGQWELGPRDLSPFEDGEIYFAEVSGTDPTGRRWRIEPRLLP